MSYISFLDMVGTRAYASISNSEYSKAIKDLHDTMRDMAAVLNGCKVYGYSDNAYIEVNSLDDMILFLKNLRMILMGKHRFFSAAVGKGVLTQKTIIMPDHKGSSMVFTSPDTVCVYLAQCEFSGIGVNLSPEVVDDLKKANMIDAYCNSVYKGAEAHEFSSIYDISYDPIGVDDLEYVISEYALTTIMSRRAGRYYVTPIVSMIKSLDIDVLRTQTEKLVETIMMKKIGLALDAEYIKEYSLQFLYALLGYVLSLEENREYRINSLSLIKKITDMCGVEHRTITTNLSKAPMGVIADNEKKKLVQHMFAMYSEG